MSTVHLLQSFSYSSSLSICLYPFFVIFETVLHSLSLCLEEKLWHAKERGEAWGEKEAKSKNKYGCVWKYECVEKCRLIRRRKNWWSIIRRTYVYLMNDGYGRANLNESNETLWLSFTIQCFLLDHLTQLPQHPLEPVFVLPHLSVSFLRALSMFIRCPTRVTPRSKKSSFVSEGRWDPSISLSIKCSMCSPRFR